MIEIIIGQQLSGASADAINRRVRALNDGRKLTPESLLSIDDVSLRSAGLSSGKIRYVRDLATKVEQGQVNFHRLAKIPDHDVIAELTQVIGVGNWSAQMYLIFVLARPDVFAPLDLGLRKAIDKWYEAFETVAEYDDFAQRWQPHRSVASWYLWRSLNEEIW